MRVAIYVRVSTERQAQAQTIEQQLTRLQEWYNSPSITRPPVLTI
jgi:DNA invertase Pin-like site-specific DNA recombinase